MDNKQALKIAEELVHDLQQACERIDIAGSVRREKQNVKDIEILAIPDIHRPPDPKVTFGKPMPPIYKTRLDQLLYEMVQDRKIRIGLNGEKFKKLLVLDRMNVLINVDLFLVLPPAQWGVLMMIRTGPVEFSRWMVSRKSIGGALPDEFIVQDGVVGYRVPCEKGFEREGQIETRNEMDYFHLCGMDYIVPSKREPRWQR